MWKSETMAASAEFRKKNDQNVYKKNLKNHQNSCKILKIHQTSLDPNCVNRRNLAMALHLFLHSKATSQCVLQAPGKNQNFSAKKKGGNKDVTFRFHISTVSTYSLHIFIGGLHLSTQVSFFRLSMAFESADKKFKVRSARTFLASPWQWRRGGSILR